MNVMYCPSYNMAGDLAFLYGSLILELGQRGLQENSYLKSHSFASSFLFSGEMLPPPQRFLVQSDMQFSQMNRRFIMIICILI